MSEFNCYKDFKKYVQTTNNQYVNKYNSALYVDSSANTIIPPLKTSEKPQYFGGTDLTLYIDVAGGNFTARENMTEQKKYCGIFDDSVILCDSTKTNFKWNQQPVGLDYIGFLTATVDNKGKLVCESVVVTPSSNNAGLIIGGCVAVVFVVVGGLWLRRKIRQRMLINIIDGYERIRINDKLKETKRIETLKQSIQNIKQQINSSNITVFKEKEEKFEEKPLDEDIANEINRCLDIKCFGAVVSQTTQDNKIKSIKNMAARIVNVLDYTPFLYKYGYALLISVPFVEWPPEYDEYMFAIIKKESSVIPAYKQKLEEWYENKGIVRPHLIFILLWQLRDEYQEMQILRKYETILNYVLVLFTAGVTNEIFKEIKNLLKSADDRLVTNRYLGEKSIVLLPY